MINISSNENDSTKWCCSLFSEATRGDEPEGLSIVAVADDDRNNYFALQFRAVAEDAQNFIINKLGNVENRIIFKMTRFINFCPWCGKDLKIFYRKHIFKDIKHMDSFAKSIPKP